MTDKGPRNRSNWEFVNQPTKVPAPETLPQTHRNLKKPVLTALIIVGVIGLAGAAYAYFRPSHPKPSQAAASIQLNGQQISIPVYYPHNLPSGYTYNNDPKLLKTNVLYFSVTGPGKQTYYVTQQAIPASFDFTAFNKKFLNPDNFSSDAGTVTAGGVGANMIASIRTNKNTWIIINASATSPLTELETVIRSFELNQ